MKRLLVTLLLAGASFASAQSNFTTGARECGLTANFVCSGIPVDGGGTVWISSKGSYSHFIQFSIPVDGDKDPFVGTATNLVAGIESITPMTTTNAPNAYKLTITSFSFTDSSGEAHSGSGTIYFHYRYAQGSGRGGSGWRLVADSGTITVT